MELFAAKYDACGPVVMVVCGYFFAVLFTEIVMSLNQHKMIPHGLGQNNDPNRYWSQRKRQDVRDNYVHYWAFWWPWFWFRYLTGMTIPAPRDD